MSAWVTIAESDLNDYLAGAQMDALKSAALAGGQTDPFARVMPDVVARVRAKVLACVRNHVSATANSVPPSLKAQTIWLVIQAMQLRLAIALRLTVDQKAAIDTAEKDLDAVAKCELVVETPDDPLDPSPVQQGGGVSLVSAATRNFTRDNMDGL